ncbi:MAG: sensor histidine kinase [Lachnospiraceae bacterium]|nr:sensor histidine kinase [Lachnospiraceae bacterium]
MEAIKDKGILLLVGILLFAGKWDMEAGVVILCIAFISACLQSYFEHSHRQKAALLGGVIMMFLRPDAVAFLPLLIYDTLLYREWIYGAAALSCLIPYLDGCSMAGGAWIVIGLLLSVLLANKTAKLQKLSMENRQIRDSGAELAMQLEHQNKELCEKQDNDIYTATLQERNRIAREIHDNVGHMISRSILMVGALKVMNKEEGMGGYLSELKNTLDEAMDSIRKSVHNLHDESVDLEQEVRKLTESFTFCEITLDYDMGKNVDRNVKYCFLAIVKEGLSNIIRHSNASKVEIVLREHPGIYQLLLEDNGTAKKAESGGMGISNMRERVDALDGMINITNDKGYRIFISIPKKRKEQG